MQYDITFNPKKSVIMIARTKADQKLEFPSFYLSEQVLETVNEVNYLFTWHIIRDDLSDGDDIQQQCYKLYCISATARENVRFCDTASITNAIETLR